MMAASDGDNARRREANEGPMRLTTSRLNRIAKRLAAPLSRTVNSRGLLKLARYAEAYLNILLGKGSGTGWDLGGEIKAAVSTLRTDRPVVFDVGANRGDWTRSFLEQVPGATVVMFEPSAGCQKHLTPLVNERVKLIPLAVGAAPGSAQLWSSSETDGAASLHPRKDTYFAEAHFESQQVEITSIDHYLSANEHGPIDFMKLDIEGHELAALQGADAALSSGRIRALAFEFGAANINSRTYFRDFWDYLKERRFDLSRILPGGRLSPVGEYSEDLEYFRGVTNYVAVCTRPAAS
jgi:FkbM family methyltransferase